MPLSKRPFSASFDNYEKLRWVTYLRHWFDLPGQLLVLPLLEFGDRRVNSILTFQSSKRPEKSKEEIANLQNWTISREVEFNVFVVVLSCLKDMTKSILLFCLNIPRSLNGIISHHWNTTDTDFVLTHWDKSSQLHHFTYSHIIGNDYRLLCELDFNIKTFSFQ